MRIRLKSIVILWLCVCLLCCVSTVKPEAPPSPTNLPTWPPTSAPQATPVASPTVALSPTPTPTIRPSPTPSPIPTAQVDLDTVFVSYADRPTWHALLGWPDTCEESFARLSRQPDDYGGIDIYPVDGNQYLIFVLCTLGPYWVEERVYWLDNSTGLLTAQPITVPVLIQDDAPEQGIHDADVLYGSFPIYYLDTQTLTTLHAYRGLKDCGVFYTYHLEDTRLALDEARYRACEDSAEINASVLNAYQWPLVYPPPLSAGPFRKAAMLPSTVTDWWGVDLRALPDGNLRLVADKGYVTYHEGQ